MKRTEREKLLAATDIYPVIIPEFCAGRSPLVVLEAVLKGGAKIVQLRDKKKPEKYAAEFRLLTTEYCALLIINDSLETALKYFADGVHLGQSDLPVSAARRHAPELLIGASVNTLDEALAAQEAGASYINIGVAFATPTKPDIKTVTGLELVKQIAPHLKIPFTVIGGIKQDNLAAVLASGARHIAVATAVTEATDVEEATRVFRDKITACGR